MKPPRFGPKNDTQKIWPWNPKNGGLEDDFPFEYEIHSRNFGEESGKIPFPYIAILILLSFQLVGFWTSQVASYLSQWSRKIQPGQREIKHPQGGPWKGRYIGQ